MKPETRSQLGQLGVFLLIVLGVVVAAEYSGVVVPGVQVQEPLVVTYSSGLNTVIITLVYPPIWTTTFITASCLGSPEPPCVSVTTTQTSPTTITTSTTSVTTITTSLTSATTSTQPVCRHYRCRDDGLLGLIPLGDGRSLFLADYWLLLGILGAVLVAYAYWSSVKRS